MKKVIAISDMGIRVELEPMSMSMDDPVEVAIDIAVVVANPIDMEVVISDISIMVAVDGRLSWFEGSSATPTTRKDALITTVPGVYVVYGEI